jgi:hypothetical protein
MRVGLRLAASAFALFVAAASVSAQPASQDAGSGEASWKAAFAQARETVRAAHEREANAREAYQEMRHRRHLRGEAKKAIVDEWDDAKAALPEAERELQDLYRTAKQAGIPPGWMRMQ